jgi:hypothetical protein
MFQILLTLALVAFLFTLHPILRSFEHVMIQASLWKLLHDTTELASISDHNTLTQRTKSLGAFRYVLLRDNCECFFLKRVVTSAEPNYGVYALSPRSQSHSTNHGFRNKL